MLGEPDEVGGKVVLQKGRWVNMPLPSACLPCCAGGWQNQRGRLAQLAIQRGHEAGTVPGLPGSAGKTGHRAIESASDGRAGPGLPALQIAAKR